jgi:hypothetical protein
MDLSDEDHEAYGAMVHAMRPAEKPVPPSKWAEASLAKAISAEIGVPMSERLDEACEWIVRRLAADGYVIMQTTTVTVWPDFGEGGDGT